MQLVPSHQLAPLPHIPGSAASLTCCHWSRMRGRYRRKNFSGKDSGSGHDEGFCHDTSSLRGLLGTGLATTLSGGSGFTVREKKEGDWQSFACGLLSLYPLAKLAGLCTMCFPRGAANMHPFPKLIRCKSLFAVQVSCMAVLAPNTTIKEVTALETHGNNRARAESVPPPQG